MIYDMGIYRGKGAGGGRNFDWDPLAQHGPEVAAPPRRPQETSAVERITNTITRVHKRTFFMLSPSFIKGD
jgi:hypothetical protein